MRTLVVILDLTHEIIELAGLEPNMDISLSSSHSLILGSNHSRTL